MLTLNDGRKEMYQWDIGRIATVDVECNFVHFSNLKYGGSLSVEVQNGVVAIPNKLLTSGEPIYCWAFVSDENGKYTKQEQTLNVNKRAKPADYVYTETETLTWKSLDERITELEKGGTGGSGVSVDDTLTISGAAADAKATGDQIRALSDEMLTEESDPTVPAWAKEPIKPVYTASEVGAEPSGTAASMVSAHNTGADTHSDIRVLISGLTDRLNALADSDDTTLDQLSEIVAYIKSNKSLIDAITTNKVSVSDIVDNLTTDSATKPLSAAQGKALKALIDAITIPEKLPNPNALTFTGAVTGTYDGSESVEINIPSGGGGSSGNDTIDILMDVTVEEAVAAVTVTLDNPRAYKELYIQTVIYGDESNGSANAMFLRVNNTATMNADGAIAWIPEVENAASNTSKSYGIAFVKLLDDCSFYYSYGSKSVNARTPNASFGEMYTNFNRETIISTLKFQSINQWTKFGVGSTIKVYGVRT